ncbi:MAG: PDZ domain-containing protein [Chloroflexi bacterium]|nr:PDZ domain-containing protein [Chloroflexota bacterium]
MSTRGAVLLAIGMLVLGLVLGMVSGGITGFLIGQNTQPAVSQSAPFFQQPNLPNLAPGQRGIPPQSQNPTPGPRGLPPIQNIQNGVIVSVVEPNSPAQKAGLQAGDIITAVDSANVDQSHPLGDLIQAHKPGDKVTLSVMRGSQSLTLNVELGQAPQNSSVPYLGIRFSSVLPGGLPRQ